MKRFTLLSLFLVIILFIGCSDSNSNPTKVTEKFTKAYYKGDFDTCSDLLGKEKFIPSKGMSKMEREAFREVRRNLDEMKHVVTPDNKDNVVEEDHYEMTFIITSEKDADFKDKFNVSVEEGDDSKWHVTDSDINRPAL